MWWRILCSFLALVSCASIKRLPRNLAEDLTDVISPSAKPNIPSRQYDPDLEHFIPEFVADAKSRGVTISSNAVNMLRRVVYVDALSTGGGPGVMAVCSRYYTKTDSQNVKWTIIEVLKGEINLYVDGEPLRLREIIYHELYHCFMNKGHLPADIPGLMAPTFNKSNQRVYKDWNGLLDEAFSTEYLNLTPNATSSSAG